MLEVSMNADEVVEKVLPKAKLIDRDDASYACCLGYYQAREYDREQLKQAILSGVLVPQESKPKVSVERLEKIIGDVHYDLLGKGKNNGYLHTKIAEAILAEINEGEA
jgi:hypothetical protein